MAKPGLALVVGIGSSMAARLTLVHPALTEPLEIGLFDLKQVERKKR